MEQSTALTYSWLGSISAPEAYPVEIYSGALRAQDYAYTFDPIWGIISSGWGEPGGVMTNDSPASELPHELDMTWYAIQEQTFYTGKWNLDKAEIAKQWQQGYTNVLTGAKEEFQSFLIGLAPQGKVVLWAYGVDKQVELAHFQAHDTVVTKEQASADFQYFFRPDYQEKIYADTALFNADLLAHLETQGWPDPALYSQYEQTFSWSLSVVGLVDTKVDYYYYQNFNGERDRFFADSASRPAARTIPKHLYAVWKDQAGKEWVADVKFAFEKVEPVFAQFDKHQDLTIQLSVDTSTNKADAWLVQADKKVILPAEQRSLVSD